MVISSITRKEAAAKAAIINRATTQLASDNLSLINEEVVSDLTKEPTAAPSSVVGPGMPSVYQEVDKTLGDYARVKRAARCLNSRLSTTPPKGHLTTVPRRAS
jgi:hypothetical protein